MKLVHNFAGVKAERDVAEAPSFLLANKRGGFFYYRPAPMTRYQGLFMPAHGGTYRILEGVSFEDFRPAVYENRDYEIVLRDGKEAVAMFLSRTGGLVIDATRTVAIALGIDFRTIFGREPFTAHLDLVAEGFAILHLVAGGEESLVSLVYRGTLDPELSYEEHRYPADERRNSPPFTRSVAMLRGRVSFLTVSCADPFLPWDRSVARTWERERTGEANRLQTFVAAHRRDVSSAYTVPYLAALLACGKAQIEVPDPSGERHTRFVAGYPWFAQVWFRDELISLAALVRTQLPETVSALRQYCEDPRLLLRGSFLGEQGDAPRVALDAAGLLCVAVQRYMERGLLTLGREARALLVAMCEEYIERFERESLIFAPPNASTWMDTVDRGGYPLEIQTLYLRILETLRMLRPDARIAQKIRHVRDLIIGRFYAHRVLLDRPRDLVLRPNAFLARSWYPQLLSPEEWGVLCERTLAELWLPWGGISTVSRHAADFCGHSTGESAGSYHSGDSWFWMNNIAAKELHGVDGAKFAPYVKKIYETSAEDLLFRGICGMPSETSSADRYEPVNSPAQLWSAATLVELIQTLSDRK